MARKVSALLLLAAIARCGSELDDPTFKADHLREHPWVSAFVLEAGAIEGLQRNSDVDILLFRYTSAVRDESSFWSRVVEQGKSAGWTAIPPTGQIRRFERIRLGRGESTEEARMVFYDGHVVVAWAQVDHLHRPGCRGPWSEDDFVEKNLWAHFEQVTLTRGRDPDRARTHSPPDRETTR